ncbi:MAG: DUF2934 domain-containing protein [Longimicrobiales bacterium]
MGKNKGKQGTSNGHAASRHSPDVRDERPAGEERERLIAVAAYYRAERRGFVPGCDIGDWLEAEAEIEQVARS